MNKFFSEQWNRPNRLTDLIVAFLLLLSIISLVLGNVGVAIYLAVLVSALALAFPKNKRKW